MFGFSYYYLWAESVCEVYEILVVLLVKEVKVSFGLGILCVCL
jgi:hypothetical protein